MLRFSQEKVLYVRIHDVLIYPYYQAIIRHKSDIACRSRRKIPWIGLTLRMEQVNGIIRKKEEKKEVVTYSSYPIYDTSTFHHPSKFAYHPSQGIPKDQDIITRT